LKKARLSKEKKQLIFFIGLIPLLPTWFWIVTNLGTYAAGRSWSAESFGEFLSYLVLGTVLVVVIYGLLALIAAIVANLAEQKGRHWQTFFILSLLFPIITWVSVALVSTDQSTLRDGTKTCPMCAEVVKQEAVLCKHCGTDLSTNRSYSDSQNLTADNNKTFTSGRRMELEAASPSIAISNPINRNSRRLVLVVAALAVVAGITIGSLATSSSESANENSTGKDNALIEEVDDELQTSQMTTENESWPPGGYELMGEDIAGKLIDHAIDCVDCGGLSWEVVSRFGCTNGLQVKANFVDDQGTVFDKHKDTIPNLDPLEKGIIEIYSYSKVPDLRIELTEVNCYN
jgi:hypothetical protein